MNEHQAAEFFETLDNYVAAKIAMISVNAQNEGLYQMLRSRLYEAESDLKEKLRDVTVDTDQ